MSDDKDKSYDEGVRDSRLSALEKRMDTVQKIGIALAGAMVASWAKLTGFFQ